MPAIDLIISEISALEYAKRIANAAACLDDLHTAEPYGPTYLESRKAAEEHINYLHDLAQFFAGNKVQEIYALDDALLSPEDAARFVGAHDETERQQACATS